VPRRVALEFVSAVPAAGTDPDAIVRIEAVSARLRAQTFDVE
jgi:hypothetical protein